MTKEEKVLLDVYRAVYSELGVDIDKLIEDGTTQQEQWFMEYEMPHRRQQEILEEVFTKHKIPKYKRNRLAIAFWLGGSPKNKTVDEI